MEKSPLFPVQFLVPDILPRSFEELAGVIIMPQVAQPPVPLSVQDLVVPGLAEGAESEGGDTVMLVPEQAAVGELDPASVLASKNEDLAKAMAAMEQAIAQLHLSESEEAQLTAADLARDQNALKSLVLRTAHLHDRTQQLDIAAMWDKIREGTSPDVPSHLRDVNRSLPPEVQEGILAGVVTGPLPSEPSVEDENDWNQSKKLKSKKPVSGMDRHSKGRCKAQ